MNIRIETNEGFSKPLKTSCAVAIVIGLLLTTLVVKQSADVVFAYGALLVILALTDVSAVTFIRRLRPFLFFALLTLFFGSIEPGATGFQWAFLTFSREAFVSAVFFSLRLLFIGGVAVWMTVSIGFDRIIRGIHMLAEKTKAVGINLTPVLFTMALAIRFLPVFQEEAERLRVGWQARGATLLGRGPIGVMRRATGMMIPLMAAALRRAEVLSDTLQLRVGKDDLANLDRLDSVFSSPVVSYPGDSVGRERDSLSHEDEATGLSDEGVRLSDSGFHWKGFLASLIAWVPIIWMIGRSLGA